MPDLSPAELLAATAADMRTVAWCRPRHDGVAVAVADWLDAKATKYGQHDAATQARMADAGVGTLAPMLRVCEAWWASRGVEPGVTT